MPLFGRDNLVGVKAPEFPAGLTWLNSEPLQMSQLLSEGKIVLVDFWTYSCINCIRTLSHLVDWDKKYRQHGLVIVGVHTPEFDFEREKTNVQKAIDNFKIEYPVVMDSDYKIWNLYTNHYWPRKLLVGPDGKIVYDHAGEGAYSETKTVIRRLLRLPESESTDIGEGSGGICYPTTGELYLGYERGVLGNKGGFHYDQTANYVLDKADRRDIFYLSGSWFAAKEHIEHPQAVSEFEDFIQLNFSALSVNVVLSSKGGPYEILLRLEDKPLGKGTAGDDVVVESGRSVLMFDRDRMYNLIKSPEYLENKHLKLFVKSDQFRAFAFTFGSCQD